MTANELNKNDIISIGGKIFLCTNVQRLTIGESVQIKISMYDYETGENSNKIFVPETKIELCNISQESIIFKEKDDVFAHFLKNSENYYKLTTNLIEDKLFFIKPDDECIGIFYQNKLISIKPQKIVKLCVIKVERKNSGWEIYNTKNVCLETGIWVNVPLEVMRNDIIEIDSETMEFKGVIKS